MGISQGFISVILSIASKGSPALIKEAREQIEKLVANVSHRELAKQLGISRQHIDQIMSIADKGSPALIKAVESKQIEDAEIKALAEGIKKQGLIHPIEIDENYLIVDGERRFRAVKILGWKTMPAIIKEVQPEMKKDQNYRLKRQLQANLTGRNLKIKEARKQIEILSNDGQSLRTLASELGISKSALHQITSIASKGSPALIKAVESRNSIRIFSRFSPPRFPSKSAPVPRSFPP